MSYNAPINETANTKISIHYKEELSPGHAFIISESREERGTQDFLRNASVEQIKDVFTAAVSPKSGHNAEFILFHAVNANDRVQNTNSKLFPLHIHTYTGAFSPEFSHITDAGIKSYTVRPNARIGNIIDLCVSGYEEKVFSTIIPNISSCEAEYHRILVNPGFVSFKAFTENAKDSHWEDFRTNLVNLVSRLVEPEKGGARIVIDSGNKAPCLAVNIYGGENLDRSGQNKQKYFEKPLTP